MLSRRINTLLRSLGYFQYLRRSVVSTCDVLYTSKYINVRNNCFSESIIRKKPPRNAIEVRLGWQRTRLFTMRISSNIRRRSSSVIFFDTPDVCSHTDFILKYKLSSKKTRKCEADLNQRFETTHATMWNWPRRLDHVIPVRLRHCFLTSLLFYSLIWAHFVSATKSNRTD